MNFLYNILIQPLVVVYNLIFTLLYGLIEEPVLTILAFSIVVNFLALPLYRKADMMQREEIEKEEQMRPYVTHIRKNFSGDERFMMQSAYYRIAHYNPLSVLKEAGPLLLQVPFFIAAYKYVSNIPMLAGASFGPIPDLLAPDGLITIGGLSINLLPIVMTVINCISGFIYSKGGPLRQKIQIYGVAAVFLVLLYYSAAGLVVYWIMNQVFSLCKNIIYMREIKHKELLPAVGALIVFLMAMIAMFTNKVDSGIDFFVYEFIILISLIIIFKTILSAYKGKKPVLAIRFSTFMNSGANQELMPLVLLTGACLFLLMGVFIPSNVLASSVTEFVNTSTGVFQWELLAYPAMVYGGLFLIWMVIIIFSRDGTKRRNLSIALWMFLGIALINQFLFDPKVGILYADLTFEGGLKVDTFRFVLNIIVCVVIAIVFLILFIKRPQWVKRITVIIGIALLGLSISNIVSISSETNKNDNSLVSSETEDKVLHLSKNGKNVVVFMLDRAIGGYVPYIFDELPELKDKFEGFIYYKDTLSFGLCTNYGSPAIFGGYEYSPAEMNKRKTELLKDKHNEALKLMPTLFSKSGYDVTVCDVPCANYQIPSDLSIFDDVPNVSSYTLEGKYIETFKASLHAVAENQKDHFIDYSLFRTVPLFIKGAVYNDGYYIGINKDKTGYTKAFFDRYSELYALPQITEAENDDKNYFLMMNNETPHEPVAMSPPSYEPDGSQVDLTYSDKNYNGLTMKLDNNTWKSYSTNAATYKIIGKWLDYLKEEGVYDNTRIIFVADHGYKHGQFSELTKEDGLDVESFWPLLMVKDFDAHEPFMIGSEFMTNADVPSLAMQGIIDDPVNPFTGNPINNSMKSGNLYVTDSWKWNTIKNNGYVFDTEGDSWWTVHDSIFDMNNWTKLND